MPSMDRFMTIISEARLVIGTLIVIATSLVGGYKMTNDYLEANFISKAVAQEQQTQVHQQIQSLKQLNKQNTAMILELRIIKYEQKMEAGYDLTPAEKREYDLLKERLEKYTDY